MGDTGPVGASTIRRALNRQAAAVATVLPGAPPLAFRITDAGEAGTAARSRWGHESLIAPELIDLEVSSVFVGRSPRR